MWKVVRGICLAGVALVVILASALPFAVPPIAKGVVEGKMAELGFPTSFDMRLGYCWNRGPELSGSILAKVMGHWSVRINFGAGFGEWHADASLPETTFSETDPLLAKVLTRYPVQAVSNLTFSGGIRLDAAVKRTRALPVPVWSVKVPVRDFCVAATVDGDSYALDGVCVTPGAAGIANHYDINPMFVRVRSATVKEVALTDLFAAIRATENRLFISEASAGFCGGRLSAFSVFLDINSLMAGLTLYLDDIDAGEALAMIKGFSGDASGLLHGKVKLFVKDGGRHVRLGDTYLYSTPGEVGKLRLSNATAITDNLEMAGVNEATRNNVSTALANLDYTVLKFNLKHVDDRQATLGVRIEGTATKDETTVPVNININLNGELEQLLNSGLEYSQKLKGKSK